MMSEISEFFYENIDNYEYNTNWQGLQNEWSKRDWKWILIFTWHPDNNHITRTLEYFFILNFFFKDLKKRHSTYNFTEKKLVVGIKTFSSYLPQCMYVNMSSERILWWKHKRTIRSIQVRPFELWALLEDQISTTIFTSTAYLTNLSFIMIDNQLDDGLFLRSIASSMMCLRLPRFWSSILWSTLFVVVAVVVVFEPSVDCSEEEEEARFVRFSCLLQKWKNVIWRNWINTG